MTQETAHRHLKRGGRIIATACSVLLGLAVILQLGLWGAAHWLGGPGGQEWLIKSLDAALKDSGYQARVQGLRVNVFGNLSIAEWEVADAEGVFARGTDLAVDFSPGAALRRHLGLSLSAQQAALLRLPLMTRSTDTPPVTGFSLPDLYFTRVSLEDFEIAALQLFSEDPDRAAVLAPSLKADVTRDGDMLVFSLSGGVSTQQSQSPLAMLLPGKLAIRGHFDSGSLQLSLEELAAEAPAYRFQASGAAGLGAEGEIELNAGLSNEDLAAVSGARIAGKAQLNLHLTGPTRDPGFKLTGTITGPVIQGQVLEDIRLQGESPAIRSAGGRIEIFTRHRDQDARVTADISLQDGKVHVKGLTGKAAGLELTADAAINRATGLAEGTAKIGVDLAAYSSLVGQPLDGKVTAAVSFAPQSETQGLKVEADINNCTVSGWKTAAASLSASFADVRSLWPTNGEISLAGLKHGDIVIPRLALEFVQKDAGVYAAGVKGAVSAPSQISFSGTAKVTGYDAATASIDDISLKMTGGGGNSVITGHADSKAVDVIVALNNLRLDIIPSGLPPSLRGMAASGKIALRGTMSAPEVTGELSFTPLSLRRRAPQITLKAKADYASGVAHGTFSGAGKGISKLVGEISIPARFALRPAEFSLSKDAPLRGSITAQGDAGTLGSLFLPRQLAVAGAIDAQVQLGGTAAAPDISGTGGIKGGRVSDIGNGFSLQGINGSATFSRNKVQLKTLSAEDGKGGTLTATGVVGIGGEASDVAVKLRRLRPFATNENFAGNVSGDLSLTGGNAGYTLKGKIVPRDVVINIPERFTSDVPKLNVIDPRKKRAKQAAGSLPPVSLSLKVDASDAIYVRGWGLDAQFGGALEVGGKLDVPMVYGNLESRRGRYEEFGKRFRIGHAILRFQGAVPPSPYLDVLAESVSGEITAQVNLKGPVKAPVVTFSSVPALPQDEVLSHILFGKSMTKISAFQAVQLARTLARFSGKGGGPDPIGLLRNVT
ncbi:MAG TPA: translocation/assembly module TamB domain-containing protein, partial [Patescibacteria group bacterium]|nr:translocation/assembly module TamB domain-containing protein [Patescibacteria group bacterium]